MQRDWYHKLPKIELHRHLEGSCRLKTVAEVIQHHNIDLPYQDLNALAKKVCIQKPFRDLKEALEKFDALQSIFVAPEVIERVTYEAIEDAYQDNIYLLELRYCPSYITQGTQLTYEDVYDAIQMGVQRARSKYNLGVGLIIMVNRMHGMEAAQATLEQAKKHGENIIGMDLADNEADVDFASFSSIFQAARKQGIPVTIHAGEIKGSVSNIELAIDQLGASRIGHGVQVIHDEAIIEKVIQSSVTLELCPTSNYLTSSVDSLKAHPIKKLFDKGVPLTINSDDPAMMEIDLSNEFRVCGETLGMAKEDITTIVSHGVQSSFIDPDRKAYYGKRYFDFLS